MFRPLNFIILFKSSLLLVVLSNVWGDSLIEPLEKIIVTAINKGECVDVFKIAGVGTPPNISANFVYSLLNGTLSDIQAKGIGIILTHFKVVGDLKLPHVKAHHIIHLEEMEFTGMVELGGHFEEVPSFPGCNFKGPFRLDNAVLGHDLNISESRFFDSASFAHNRISGNIHAELVQFINDEGTADCSQTLVNQSADFRGSFWGDADFSCMTIHGSLLRVNMKEEI